MKTTHYIAAAAALLFSSTAWAGALTVPNTFTAGTPAVAADVNANFSAVKTAVDDNNTRINTNAASIATNATAIAANTASIPALQNAVLVRTINVSPVIGGGGVIDPVASGTALINAVAAITGSSVSNQFTVKLEPGIYDLGTQMLTVPDGVNLEGAGQGVATINGGAIRNTFFALPTDGVLRLSGNHTIRNITLVSTNPIDPGNGIAVIGGGTILIENAEIKSGYSILWIQDNTLTTNISITHSALSATNPSSNILIFGNNTTASRVNISYSSMTGRVFGSSTVQAHCFSVFDTATFTALPQAGC